MRKEWDTYILTKLAEVEEDVETLRVIRDLTPGTHKYNGKFVKCLVSRDPEKYPDKLFVRLGRGQLTKNIWSVKITEYVEGIPTKPYHMSGGISLKED
ncbi:MAG: phenylphosphate carboxylase subunit gamma [Clostridia bacterium]|nr:phenylphosphate carboxylase subunit gamma [Clostridia bacterium]